MRERGRLPVEGWAVAADWDYAQLTRKAAESGGPEMLMAAVKTAARSEGRSQGAKIGFAAAAVAAGALEAGRRGYVAWDARRSERSAAAAAAERELVQRLNHEAGDSPHHDMQDAPSDENDSADSADRA